MAKIQGGCHCGGVRYAFTVDDDKLPLSAVYCHCDDCRLTIGGFCALFLEVPRSTLVLTEGYDGALVRYNTSSSVTRSHCSRCGTSVTFQRAGSNDLPVLAATIDIPDGVAFDSIVDPKFHIFLDSTPHGGIATVIDDALPRYAKFPQDGPWINASTEGTHSYTSTPGGEEITGRCHCGGIEFTIARAPINYAADPVLRNWIKQGRRFSAIHCSCDTRRRVSGAPFWTWAFIPRKLITFTSNATERVYRSSTTKPCERRFCGTCGCTYAYTASPGFEMWDISAALLSAEDWLSFRPSPAGEDPADEALGRYINGWLDSPELRPTSYAVDGEKYNPSLVAAVRRGLAHCERF